jgi:hypothetical protein
LLSFLKAVTNKRTEPHFCGYRTHCSTPVALQFATGPGRTNMSGGQTYGGHKERDGRTWDIDDMMTGKVKWRNPEETVASVT